MNLFCTTISYAIILFGGNIMNREKIDELIHYVDSQEATVYLISSMINSKYNDYFQQWIHDNLLTRSEARKYTDQSDTGIGQTIKNHLLFPFYSKGDGPGKVNLFLKKDTILYGENKRRNVIRKPEKN